MSREDEITVKDIINHQIENFPITGNETLEDIVGSWLDVWEYDGLWCPNVPCGCKKDDLFSCGECNSMDCIAGYLITDPERLKRTVDCDTGWAIGKKNENPEALFEEVLTKKDGGRERC